MTTAHGDTAHREVTAAMAEYFEGLYRSDTTILRRVFHPRAQYACATDGTLLQLAMDEYWVVVDARESPASRGDVRHDRIVSIDLAGPVTAIVRAECAVAPKSFLDLLTFVKLDGRWQIIAKVFHYEVVVA